ncbi:MAG: hypothetical protein ABSC11_02170 [Smithella sp.]|jgi:hypothetical protein
MAKVTIMIEDQKGKRNLHVTLKADPEFKMNEPMTDAQVLGMRIMKAISKGEIPV